MKRNLIVVLLFRAFVLAGILRIYVVACDSLNDINDIVREGNEVTRVPQREELEAPAAATDVPPSSKFFLLEAPQVLIKPEGHSAQSPGTSCQATVMLSLWDDIHSPRAEALVKSFDCRPWRDPGHRRGRL